MDERMKQRAVGAVVLVSLAVIFIPMVLDVGDEDRTLSQSDSVIPPKPEGEFKTITIPLKREFEDKSVAEFVPPKREFDEAQAPVADAEPQAPAVAAKSEFQLQPMVQQPVAASEPKTEAVAAPVKEEPQVAAAEEPKEAPAPVPAAKPAESAPRIAATPQPSGPVTPATRAWTVQVASFSDRKNAEALKEKLRKAGYRAFLASTRTADGKVIIRVRVGPQVAREDADEIRQKIEKEYKLQALVIPHR